MQRIGVRIKIDARRLKEVADEGVEWQRMQ